MPQKMLDPLSARHPLDVAGKQTPATVCQAWYEAFGPQLYGYLRFHVPTPDLAEDLTAEVFLRALKGFERFDSAVGSPRPWLFRIAQNVLRDQHRQAKRRQVLSLTGMHDLRCEAPSPEERILWEEEVAGLLAAMKELSPNDRRVIGLCYGSELSIAEAGEVLGLSATATRTRLWRALGRLRRVLTP
jgi:RNA polymerase sigma-70 factor (ECF subfamily)